MDVDDGEDSYCYFLLFEDDIIIMNGTKLRYHIFHVDSQNVAVGFVTKDGISLFDTGLTDQNGLPIAPEYRQNPLNEWLYIEVDLTPLEGKVIDYIIAGYNDPVSIETGNFRSYIDNLSIGLN
jgi:hypothetical protein